MKNHYILEKKMNFIEKPFEIIFKYNHIFEQSNLHYLEQLFEKV